MSVQSQDTYTNANTPLSVVGNGGGGSAVSTFSTLSISSLEVYSVTAGYITSGLVSSIIGDFEDIGCSSISTLGMILDGNILTSAGSELLLNGVPIATTSNISSLQDWSYEPAISTLNMNGNSTINGTLLSTITINAGSAVINNLVCNDISTHTLTVQSTIHAISTISSLEIEAQVALFSSINGAVFPAPSVSSFQTASVSSLGVSSINGIAYPPPQVDLSQWATLPAISSVRSGAGPTDDLTLRGTRYINAFATGVSTVVDRGADVGGNAFYRVTAQNGNRGEITLTAEPGAGGIYGEINLIANGGTTPGLVAQGGLINITANTPLGTDPTLTSAIKLSGAGINSYAGAVPPVGSLLGYNFIYGTLGVNLCAGLPSVVPNVPGTTYLYGTTGITLGSQTNTASDFTQSAGGIYTTLLTGYWAGGVFSPQNLLIRGRQIPVIGNSYVSLSNVNVLSFDTGASGAITGVQTINGSAYPPASPALPANLSCATLVASTFVSTPQLFVSSVNGAVYPPPAGSVPENLVVSSVTSATFLSTLVVNTSSINGYSYNAPTLSSLVVNGSANATNFGGISVDVNTISSYSLSIRGSGGTIGGILLENNLINPSISMPVYFQSEGASTMGLRARTFNENVVLEALRFNTPYTGDNGVYADVAVGTLYLSQSTATHAVYLKANPANTSIVASVPMSISSLTDVSTINGAVYPPPASGGIQSTIANAGSFVNIDGTGTISISTVLTGGTHNLNVDVDNNINLQVENGGIYLLNNNATTHVQLDGAGNVDILANGNNSINLDSNGGITITAQTPGSVNITNLSTINGAPYPPPASAGIQSTIASGPYNVNIDGAGGISTVGVAYSLNVADKISLVSNQFGVELVNTDTGNAFTLLGPGGMTATGPGNFVSGLPIYTSSLYISSVNGAVYPPPASVPADLVVSTLVASQAISTNTLSTLNLWVSSVNGAVYPPASSGGSPNGSFSTIVVSSFITSLDVNVLSSMTFGDTALSTGAYLSAPRGGSADIVIELGIAGTTNGVLRVYNANTLGINGAIEVQNLQQVSSIVKTSNSGGTDINLVAGPGTAGVTGFVNIKDPLAPYGKLQVGQITQLNLIVGISSVMIDTTTSTLHVSSVNSMIFDDSSITANNIVVDADLTLAGATTLTINGDPGTNNYVVTHRAGYPQWGKPALIPTVLTITNGTPLNITLDGNSVGGYYCLQTNAGPGLATANFLIGDGFNAGDTFYVKNVDKLGATDITITLSSVTTFCNNVLSHPTADSNSVLCVGYYDGENMYIY